MRSSASLQHDEVGHLNIRRQSSTPNSVPGSGMRGDKEPSTPTISTDTVSVSSVWGSDIAQWRTADGFAGAREGAGTRQSDELGAPLRRSSSVDSGLTSAHSHSHAHALAHEERRRRPCRYIVPALLPLCPGERKGLGSRVMGHFAFTRHFEIFLPNPATFIPTLFASLEPLWKDCVVKSVLYLNHCHVTLMEQIELSIRFHHDTATDAMMMSHSSDTDMAGIASNLVMLVVEAFGFRFQSSSVLELLDDCCSRVQEAIGAATRQPPMEFGFDVMCPECLSKRGSTAIKRCGRVPQHRYRSMRIEVDEVCLSIQRGDGDQAAVSAALRRLRKGESCTEGCRIEKHMLVSVPREVLTRLKEQEREDQRAAFLVDQMIISKAKPSAECQKSIVRITLIELNGPAIDLNQAVPVKRLMGTQSGCGMHFSSVIDRMSLIMPSVAVTFQNIYHTKFTSL